MTDDPTDRPPSWIPDGTDCYGPPLPLSMRLRAVADRMAYEEHLRSPAERATHRGMLLDTRNATLEADPAAGPVEAHVVCSVCGRAAVPAGHRWTWLACPLCREVDSATADRLGTRRLLPLARHSVMNGAAAPLAADGRPGGAVSAAHDQIGALARDWEDLRAWRVLVVRRLAADALPGAEARAGAAPVVRWGVWQDLLPPSPRASIAAHSAYLSERRPTLARLLAGTDPIG